VICDTQYAHQDVKVKEEEPRVIALHRGSGGKDIAVEVNLGTLITAILDHVQGKMLSNCK